jgi:hypothetical protein
MPTHTEPLTSVKTRLGEYFRSRLHTSGLNFSQNNADTDIQPPWGVVTVTKLTETTPGSHVYTGEVKIALITSIDISSSSEHDLMLEQVMDLLAQIPKTLTDHEIGIRMFGWVLLYSETIIKSESQSMSDVLTLITGCSG